MPCGPVDFLQGGTLLDPRLINPDSEGGVFSNPILDSPSVKGDVALDDAAAASLAGRVGPLVRPPLDRDEAAAVFRDSTNGLPLVPDTRIVTEQDAKVMVQGLEHRAETLAGELRDELGAITPGHIAGQLSDSTNGNPLAPGTRVVTEADLAAKVTGLVSVIYQDKDGNPLPPGTRLLSRSEVEDLVRLAICEGCGAAGVSGLTWDPSTRTITVISQDSAGNTTQESVALTGIPLEPTEASPPVADTGTGLPNDIFGTRTRLLATPDKWLRFTVNGVDGVVPWYAL
jgi:hypothetical protein